MDDGAMMGWTWPPIVGLVAMLAIITLIVVIVWALLDRTRRPHDPDAASQRMTTGDPALAALRDRFARGEIDENEYDARRRPLEQ